MGHRLPHHERPYHPLVSTERIGTQSRFSIHLSVPQVQHDPSKCHALYPPPSLSQ